MALLPEPVIDPHAEVTLQEGKQFLAEGVWGSPTALKIVIQDTERAETEENRRQFVMGWGSARDLYSSLHVPAYWPGTQQEAASVNFFTLATAVNGINPQVLSGLFFENPPFMVAERPGTTAQAARAVSALLGFQLEDINFREEIRLGGMNFLLFGTGIFQGGWEKYTRKRTIVKRKTPDVQIPSTVPGMQPTTLTDDELEEEVIEEVVDRPTFEHIINLREILVDPGLSVPDIRKAKYVVRRRYMTWEDLDKLRDREGYDIPSRDKLLQLFFPPREPVEANVSEEAGRNPLLDARAESRWEDTTADPFHKPLEVLERWDNDTYIVVLQKKAVIYNGANIYGKIPFYSIGWWDAPGSFWSLGLGRTIGTEQRLQTGITNLMLNVASLNLNTPLVKVRGKSVPTQNIRIGPGKIIEVDNKGDLEPLQRSPAVPEAEQLLGMSAGRVSMVAGNNPLADGSASHSNMARSAAGAMSLAQSASTAVSDAVDKLANQVVVPYLYDMMEMNKSFLPISHLRYIMSEELQHDYVQTGGDLIDILNARVKVSILAGSKMISRRNMAQSLPLMTQTFASPALTQQLAMQGMKIDWLEIAKMWMETSDWKNMNDVIVPMSPEDLQRQQQQSQMALSQTKGAQQSQLEQQKFAHQQELADAENTARAARDVLRIAFKSSAESDAIKGEPDATSGFGSAV